MKSCSPSWNYGIRDAALQWIKSYFSYRYQFVQFNQTCSPMQTIKCGVPQGSILGPLFFIFYINDLANAPELIELLLFADDTSIFYSHSNLNTLASVLNNELKNRQSMTACSLLRLFLLRIRYLAAQGTYQR